MAELGDLREGAKPPAIWHELDGTTVFSVCHIPITERCVLDYGTAERALKPAQRIDSLAVDEDLEVQVATSGCPGGADPRDGFPALDNLTDGDVG